MWGRFIRVGLKPFNATDIMCKYCCLWVYGIVIIVILY